MNDLSSVTQFTSPALPSIGERGETFAAEHLIEQGYRIVLTNFKVPVGRNSKGVSITGEIDIIALDGETLCFVEVKTRSSEDFLPAIKSVDIRKQRQIIRTAKIYRRLFNIHDISFRYDVVTVLMPKDDDPTCELLRGFFSESKFRKRSWSENSWQEFASKVIS